MSRALVGAALACAWCSSLTLAEAAKEKMRALLVVGQDDDVPLYADLAFAERLTVWGFEVTRIRDLNVTEASCEAFSVMAVSASVSGGAIGDRLNTCTTPQIIWEVGIFNENGMSGPAHKDAWVTSEWWNTNHQDAWEKTGYWPPAPTGANILITEDGAADPLAAGLSGEVPFFSVSNYGVNWANVNRLGAGAKVVGILPPDSTKDWPSQSEPLVHKAVLFYYEQGSELYAEEGATPEKSPAFRIGFPPYHFYFGSNPTCGGELAGVPGCSTCAGACKTAKETVAEDVNPMPLSCDGVKLLDAAIKVLIKEARKCTTTHC